MRAAVASGLAAVSISLTGCVPDEGHGYVQIRRAGNPSLGQFVHLNGAAVEELRTASDVLIRHRSGPAKLELVRNGTTWTLCAFTLGKNRIVTATLVDDRGIVRCAVKT